MAYTDIEKAAIKAFRHAFNYTTPEKEIDDNATALSVRDIAESANITINQAKGVAASLSKKGLLDTWDEPDLGEYSLHITQKGIIEHYAMMAAAI